jgi:hypothetical protein
MNPSPDFKRIIDAVYELQLDGTVTDLAGAVEHAKRLMNR